MKKEEKTKLTRERIIQAAMEEFGTRGYDGAALNSICGRYEISKGLIYHNFDGKDDLYLSCVKHCFKEVVAYLKDKDISDDLEKYMQLRFRYFSEHPLQARIFFEAILQPPPGLAAQIKELRAEFDEFNRQVYRGALSHMTLREEIDENAAMEYYEIMQEMFNGYFSSPAYGGKDFPALVADHEKNLIKMINLMLYGIAERSREK